MHQQNSKYIILDDEIHIWKFHLESIKSFEKFFFNLLSEGEKKQADKIKIENVRKIKIISKAVLKNIISNYLGINTEQIEFSYNQFGKPCISESINTKNLNFNISHSGNLCIIALTKNNLIGIDIEQMNAIDQIDDVINSCFTDAEKKLLSGSESSEKTEIFYKIWTAKEAFVKAIGMGFSFPLKNISLTFNHDNELSIKNIDGPSLKAADWKAYNFIPYNNYTSTIIVNSNAFNVKNFTWSEFLYSANSVLI